MATCATCGGPGVGMPVVFCNGMGVDSAAILTWWLDRPASRDFCLHELVVLTAMTGDEYDETRRLMETHLLPLMREHGVRYVQLARCGQSESAWMWVVERNRPVRRGYQVLSDSETTGRMFMCGTRWRLRDELLSTGTLPQLVSGKRLCSYRAKGQVLDRWIKANIAGPFRHVIGFAADEQDRITRDTSYTSADPQIERRPWYPLDEWGWDRDACDRYLQLRFGERWKRSCCGYCCFQSIATGRRRGTRNNRAELVARWRDDRAAAALVLELEWNAVALNPRSRLFGYASARRVAVEGGLADLVDEVDDRIGRLPWAIYQVRRAYPAVRIDKDRPSQPGNWHTHRKGQAVRSLRTIATGRPADMNEQLTAQGGVEEGEHGIVRLWRHIAGPPYPTQESFLVAAPAGIPDKVGRGFDAIWSAAERAARLRLPKQQVVQLDLLDTLTALDGVATLRRRLVDHTTR